MSLRKKMLDQLAKQCAVSYQCWAPAHTGNQPSDYHRQPTDGMNEFNFSDASWVFKVERRQVTTLAYTMTLLPSSLSIVEDDARLKQVEEDANQYVTVWINLLR